jgi:hypothetical protein
LLLTTGQLAGHVLGAMGYAHPVEGGVDALMTL